MREGARLHTSGTEMSATVLSAFYDMDMLYKDKGMNMNALHINSLLDKKAVGAPVPAPGSGGPFTPGFFRRNSSSGTEPLNNRFPLSSFGNLKENNPGGSSANSATALMNKENKFRDRAFSEGGDRGVLQQKPGSQINSTRYKTELCRPFEENGSCKYGEKCQFAHGFHELRSLSRHPKYKTEPCRTFHTIGFCPYGPRCHFIHNAEERRPAPANNSNLQPGGEAAPRGRELCGFGHREVSGSCTGQQQQQQLGFSHKPKLQHSLSFSGFSLHHGPESPLLGSPTSRTPPPASSSSSSASSFYDEALSPSSCIHPGFAFPGQDLKALLAPLAVQHSPAGGCYTNTPYYGTMQSGVCPPSPPALRALQGGLCPPSPPALSLSLRALRRLSDSPVFEPPPSPPDSLSDRDSYASGSLSSSGSLSGSESPGLDAGRRLPIFSRLSISDD